MARPERNDVDYFPFLCKEGKAMFYIENKYGNDGYASWIKILRQLAVTNYHYLNLSNETELMFLSSKCKVSENILCEIINDLCKLGEFNKELWDANKILYSDKFITTIQDAYKKRGNKCMSLEGLRILLHGLGILNTLKSSDNSPVNPQSKVKYSKVKETKEDIDSRKLKFASTLKDYSDKYSRELLVEFKNYWTEPNKSNTKFRQELEKTWDLQRRLETWAKNDNNFSNKKTETTPQIKASGSWIK